MRKEAWNRAFATVALLLLIPRVEPVQRSPLTSLETPTRFVAAWIRIGQVTQ